MKGTLRDLSKLTRQHAQIVGRASPVPVLFARANLHPWRVWVGSHPFNKTYHRLQLGHADYWPVPMEFAWVEITPEMFFEEVMPCVR